MKQLTKLEKIDPAAEARAAKTVLKILRRSGDMKEADLLRCARDANCFGVEIPDEFSEAMHVIIKKLIAKGKIRMKVDPETGRHIYRAYKRHSQKLMKGWEGLERRLRALPPFDVQKGDRRLILDHCKSDDATRAVIMFEGPFGSLLMTAENSVFWQTPKDVSEVHEFLDEMLPEDCQRVEGPDADEASV